MKVWTITAVCVAALSSAQAAESCVSMCVEIYKPVCGSDGKTYGNQCRFDYEKCSTKNESLKVASEGACPESATGSGSAGGQCTKGCPKIMMPVCGSDGKTYNNECELTNAKCSDKTLKLASKGECSDSSSSGNTSAGDDDCKTTMCPADYAPVCGSDDKTYSNECVFKNAKCKTPSLTLKRDGACASGSPSAKMGSLGGDGSEAKDKNKDTATSTAPSSKVPAPAASASSSVTTAVQVVASTAIALAVTLLM